MKYVEVDGYRFTKDEKTGYYRCNKLRKRLHQYVWEKSNGRKQPPGTHVHHKDENKGNNDPENLILLTSQKHGALHGEGEEIKVIRRKRFLKNVIPAAVKWHKSAEGLAWHKEHARGNKNRATIIESNCKFCLQLFQTSNNGRNLFCSNRCKSAQRRKDGADNEKRKCSHCGNEFISSKYSKTKFCSRSCTMKERHKNKVTLP